MPGFNVNANFAKGKACTVPVVDEPKNLKESLCIDKAHVNGIFKIEPMHGSAMYDQ